MMRRIAATLLPALLSCVYGNALTENFASGIPSSYTLTNANQASVKANIYNHIGDDEKVAWLAGQLPDGYGRVALAPTRNAGGAATDRRMRLPSVAISDASVLRWDARSLHSHLPESYEVYISVDGAEWTFLYGCAAESSSWTTHFIELGEYSGKSVEVEFRATTTDGFMLAIDNILIGEPEDSKYTFTSAGKHFVPDSESFKAGGTLTNYGKETAWTAIKLKAAGLEETAPLEPLAPGESIDIEFTIPVEGVCTYTLTAIDADGVETELYSDFACASAFPRLSLIDRCSGTWCNNCPPMELTTSRLERRYGDEILVIEAHINDKLQNTDYNTGYLSDFCYAIPMLVPNHDRNGLVYSLKSADYYATQLASGTNAMISASAVMTRNGDIKFDSTILFSETIDNSDDRYRVAYMLLADFHDPLNGYLLQSNSAVNFTTGQYYYQPDRILPEMMYFSNVPLEASVAVTGVPASLPTTIHAGTTMGHSFSLAVPENESVVAIRGLAMVIDTSTGIVLNAAVTEITDESGISDPSVDIIDEGEGWDILGRPATDNSRGLIIKRNSKTISI